MKVLITGATGFVGAALVQKVNSLYDTIALVRTYSDVLPTNIQQLVAKNIFEENLPDNIDVIIHLAGRAHILSEQTADPLTEFRKVNVEGTLQLARQALEKKVKRFIFMSSIGVNGSSTIGKPFSEQDDPRPNADYAISKLEAEQALKELFKDTETELVVIRPPLVYAADAPGNFARLLKLASTNFPLPFRAVYNKRSFVALENLIDFIVCCITHPNAKNELFLISDFESLSTTQLLIYLRQGMGKKPNLIYIPKFMMRFGASCIGKMKLYEQLYGSLEVDISKARALLGWQPSRSIEATFQKAGEVYVKLR